MHLGLDRRCYFLTLSPNLTFATAIVVVAVIFPVVVGRTGQGFGSIRIAPARVAPGFHRLPHPSPGKAMDGCLRHCACLAPGQS